MASTYYSDGRYINLANTYYFDQNVSARKGREDDCNLAYINNPNVPDKVLSNVYTFKANVCPGNWSADPRAVISEAEMGSVAAKNPYLQDPNNVASIAGPIPDPVCYSITLKNGGRDGGCQTYDPTKYASREAQQQAMYETAQDYQNRLGNLPGPSFPTAYVLIGGGVAIALLLWVVS